MSVCPLESAFCRAHPHGLPSFPCTGFPPGSLCSFCGVDGSHGWPLQHRTVNGSGMSAAKACPRSPAAEEWATDKRPTERQLLKDVEDVKTQAVRLEFQWSSHCQALKSELLAAREELKGLKGADTETVNELHNCQQQIHDLQAETGQLQQLVQQQRVDSANLHRELFTTRQEASVAQQVEITHLSKELLQARKEVGGLCSMSCGHPSLSPQSQKHGMQCACD